MAKHQDLCFQRGSRSEKSDQPAPDQPAELVHRAEDSADSLPRANRIRFATATMGQQAQSAQRLPLAASPDGRAVIRTEFSVHTRMISHSVIAEAVKLVGTANFNA